jgi:DNA-binding Lrp family transcriptional regulator
VLDAFEWTAGTFTVLDSAVVPDNAKAVTLALQGLLDESRKRAESRSIYADDLQFRLVDDPAMQAQVSLRGDEFKILFKLSADGRTFRELVMDLGQPRPELAERLRKLVGLGLVEIIRAEPEADVTAPQKKMTFARKRTLVGSLTPDNKPDSVYPLLDAESGIGRAQDNSISIPDGSVSAKHARIVRTDEGFAIEDLQSRNGTFVNGEKVDGRRMLVDGDLIRVGKVIMTFNVAREVRQGETTEPEVRLV